MRWSWLSFAAGYVAGAGLVFGLALGAAAKRGDRQLEESFNRNLRRISDDKEV